MPKQECENDWYLRYVAEYSVKQTEEGWRWKFDDSLFYKLGRPKGYEYIFKCPLFIAEEKLAHGFKDLRIYEVNI